MRNYGLRVDGYYGIGQWMYRLVEGTAEPPVVAPEEGAGKQAQADYEAQLAQWETLSLENMQLYSLDLDAARQLLTENI